MVPWRCNASNCRGSDWTPFRQSKRSIVRLSAPSAMRFSALVKEVTFAVIRNGDNIVAFAAARQFGKGEVVGPGRCSELRTGEGFGRSFRPH